MRVSDHPRVSFRKQGELENDGGYLAIIDGVPWLAATLEDAHSRVPATMIRLEPQQLEAQRHSETDDLTFHYQRPLPVC